MHYAAWRLSRAARTRDRARWRRRYCDLRNRIVLGNRKLTYRAVQKWSPPAQLADDLAAECQVVLIKAVAAFNPWLGIRFSTYAFTCLMRALSRLSQKCGTDRYPRWISLECLPGAEPSYVEGDEPLNARLARVSEFLHVDHPRLTPREKLVLTCRFHPGEAARRTETLEEVGRALGLSKERVRQVQNSALGKLRDAFPAGTPPS
jgi:RNA polymerase primary sigma factor